jgi:hypothetical protein
MRQKEKAQAMLLSILSPFNDETLPPPSSSSTSDEDEKSK